MRDKPDPASSITVALPEVIAACPDNIIGRLVGVISRMHSRGTSEREYALRTHPLGKGRLSTWRR